MNQSTVKLVRKYLKDKGYDITTPEGKEIYRSVKRNLTHNEVKTILAGKKKR